MDHPEKKQGQKKPRKPEHKIPASELAWVRADSHDYWTEQPGLTKDQVVKAHYDNRQRVGVVVGLKNPELRKVEEYKSMLKEIEMEEPEEIQPESPDFAYRNHWLPYGAGITTEDYKPNSPELVNEKEFEELQKRLKKIIAGFGSVDWMKTAVWYQLGPQHIRKVVDCHIGRRNKELGEHDLFVNNNQSVACLVVSLGSHTRESTVQNIERFLRGEPLPGSPTRSPRPPKVERPDEVMISEPGSGFGVCLRHGEDPVIVRNAKESRFALIFDTHYVRYVEKMEKEEEELKKKLKIDSSQQFYEMFFASEILSSRLLSDPEKRWVEEELGRNDIRPRPLRLLEFEDSEKRRKAVEKRGVEVLDLFFCDSQFGYRNFHESVHLYVKYEMKPKNIECVAVYLKCELDKRLAESAFRYHHLSTFFFERDFKTKNQDLKYQQDCKVLVIQDFPRYMFKPEVQEWFVRRICELNHIQIEKVEPFTERLEGVWKSHIKAKQREIAPVIEFEFYRIGQINNIYRPIDEPWEEVMQGAMGARCFFQLVKTERPDRPWKVSRKKPIKNEENLTVHFKSLQTGLDLIKHVLNESHNRAVFQVDRCDRQGPEIRPCYRKTFAISRRLRAVLDHKLRKFDNDIRRLFTVLTKNEDPMMMGEESIYFRLRIHEEWKSGSEAGIIGVMGWTVQSVRLFAQKLEELLQPEIVKVCPHLLHGIGERYAKSLEQKYTDSLIVEVDRFNEEIKLIGDASEKAIKDLESYSERRGKIGVRTAIPLHYPWINSRISNLFYKKIVEKFRQAMGINYLFYDREQKLIEFEGSIEQYEKLMKMLEELSMDYYKKETNGRDVEELPQQTCPTCWTEIGINNDFYRFQCGHVMCRLCTNAKVRNIGSSDIKIKCDYAGCEKFVTPSEILNIILGGPDRIRDFDTAKLHPLIVQAKQSIFFSNPDVIGCTSINCPGLLSKSDGDLQQYKTCTSCSRQYCRQCLAEPHKDSTCEEYSQVRHVDYSMKAYMKASGPSKVKKCPKCSTVVEKAEGCNHIECKCGLHFCWLCMYSSENGSGPIYAHMADVHGGHGGYMVIPEDLPDADPFMQHHIQQGIELQFRAEQFEGEEEEEDFSESDETETDDEARRQHNRLPRRARLGRAEERERVRREHLHNLGWPQQMPPPPPPPQRPQRPPHLYEFPDILEEILVDVELSLEDRELWLGYLNRLESMADRDETIAQLVQIFTDMRDGAQFVEVPSAEGVQAEEEQNQNNEEDPRNE